jgi:hypothetical protein
MPAPSGTKAREGEEVWELTTAGRLWLHVTSYTRTGQPITKDVSYGPNKAGHKIRISEDDRHINQENCADDHTDPFRNGMLVRVDKSQQDDDETASENAIGTDELMAIFAKNGNAFQSAVKKLNEVNVRRLYDLAEPLDATAKQVEFLTDYIAETYRKGGPQPSLAGQRDEPRDGGERLS